MRSFTLLISSALFSLGFPACSDSPESTAGPTGPPTPPETELERFPGVVPGTHFYPNWPEFQVSNDGREIFFAQRAQEAELKIADASSGQTRVVATRLGQGVPRFALSADESKLYYGRLQDDARVDYCQLGLEAASEPQVIAPDVGNGARSLSPDGRWVAYWNSEHRRTFLYDRETGARRAFGPAKAIVSAELASWAPGGESLLLVPLTKDYDRYAWVQMVSGAALIWSRDGLSQVMDEVVKWEDGTPILYAIEQHGVTLRWSRHDIAQGRSTWQDLESVDAGELLGYVVALSADGRMAALWSHECVGPRVYTISYPGPINIPYCDLYRHRLHVATWEGDETSEVGLQESRGTGSPYTTGPRVTKPALAQSGCWVVFGHSETGLHVVPLPGPCSY